MRTALAAMLLATAGAPLGVAAQLLGGHQAQLARLECVPAGMEVEVSSDTPFPVRNALVELRIGAVVSSLSRYAPDGDLHTLIFVLSDEQAAEVSPFAEAVVGFNPGAGSDTWLVGSIDPTTAQGCPATGEEDQLQQR